MMFEASEIEGNEIKGEYLREWAGKGYSIRRHGGDPCFWCTLHDLSNDLPVVFKGA